MHSTVSEKGQTTIPIAIRKHFHLSAGDCIEWIIDQDEIRVIPVKDDPIAMFRSKGKGGSVLRLLADRTTD